MKISVNTLRGMGACRDGLAWFEGLFGEDEADLGDVLEREPDVTNMLWFVQFAGPGDIAGFPGFAEDALRDLSYGIIQAYEPTQSRVAFEVLGQGLCPRLTPKDDDTSPQVMALIHDYHLWAACSAAKDGRVSATYRDAQCAFRYSPELQGSFRDTPALLHARTQVGAIIAAWAIDLGIA